MLRPLDDRDNGRSTKGDLLFREATFGKLSLVPKEGGTCSCVARAQVLPNPDETAKLVALLKHEIPVSLDSSDAVDLKAEAKAAGKADDDEDDDE